MARVFSDLRRVVFLGALTIFLTAACQTASVPEGADAIVLPSGAPPIISDFRSALGVKGRLRNAPHQGIDIAGPEGQPILAIADGTVLETDVGDCWGPTITIDHGTGPDGLPLIALYGHMGDMLVESGDEVQRGQLVATLGSNQNQYRCIGGVRHIHLQLGREYRTGPKGSNWGHTRWLVDGGRGINPHRFWADGPGKVTCFEEGRTYAPGTLTYPLPCAGA